MALIISFCGKLFIFPEKKNLFGEWCFSISTPANLNLSLNLNLCLDEYSSNLYSVNSLTPSILNHNHNTLRVCCCCRSVFNGVATPDFSFFPTARSISTYFYLRMSATILPIIPYIFKNVPTFVPTFFILFEVHVHNQYSILNQWSKTVHDQ